MFSACTLITNLSLVRHIPDWFPGAGFKQIAKEWRTTIYDMVDRTHDYVKQQMVMLSTFHAGQFVTTPRPSEMAPSPLLPSCLKISQMQRTKRTSSCLQPLFLAVCVTCINAISSVSSLVGTAGTDTVGFHLHSICLLTGGQTVAAVYAFFKAMLLFPDVQRKAQAEIDANVGIDRLPRSDDRERLPYMNALVLEVSRWHTVAPLGEFGVRTFCQYPQHSPSSINRSSPFLQGRRSPIWIFHSKGSFDLGKHMV